MAIKINNDTVINDSFKGQFKRVNPGQYTTAERDNYNASVGDIIYNTTELKLQVYGGDVDDGGYGWVDIPIRNTGLTLGEGGTVSDPGNGWKYHAFTNTGASTFSITRAGFCEVLIVGAGGSGSGGWGGSGGGGGGVLHAENIFLGVGTYPVVVGAGVSTPGQNQSGRSGGDSSFGVYSAGGGSGGSYGGSGGGTGGPQGTVVDAADGSFEAIGPNGGGGAARGGGGGAGWSGSTDGGGGIGIRMPGFTNYGTPGPQGSGGYFAGGGSSTPSNPGSAGGGTNSPAPSPPNSGGGGGSTNDGYPNTSGPGIVIVRYRID